MERVGKYFLEAVLVFALGEDAQSLSVVEIYAPIVSALLRVAIGEPTYRAWKIPADSRPSSCITADTGTTVGNWAIESATRGQTKRGRGERADILPRRSGSHCSDDHDRNDEECCNCGCSIQE